jgi:hypothetical protein
MAPTQDEGRGSGAAADYSTSQTLDLELWWPDLFEGLDEAQRRVVVQTCAGSWHEGWTPNRADVRGLADLAAGRITSAEYRRRAFAAAGVADPFTT